MAKRSRAQQEGGPLQSQKVKIKNEEGIPEETLSGRKKFVYGSLARPHVLWIYWFRVCSFGQPKQDLIFRLRKNEPPSDECDQMRPPNSLIQ